MKFKEKEICGAIRLTPIAHYRLWLSALVNNQPKKITLALVLFFAILVQHDLSLLFLEIPKFSQLSVSDGKIKIDIWKYKIGHAFTLVTNDQKLRFNCGAPGGSNIDCVNIDKIPEYQNKNGKVWWYRSKNIGWYKDDIRLYQLEVDGKLVITYQKQVDRYLLIKRSSFYPNIIFFSISLIMFFLMQFANNPVTPIRKEK